MLGSFLTEGGLHSLVRRLVVEEAPEFALICCGQTVLLPCNFSRCLLNRPQEWDMSLDQRPQASKAPIVDDRDKVEGRERLLVPLKVRHDLWMVVGQVRSEMLYSVSRRVY